MLFEWPVDGCVKRSWVWSNVLFFSRCFDNYLFSFIICVAIFEFSFVCFFFVYFTPSFDNDKFVWTYQKSRDLQYITPQNLKRVPKSLKNYTKPFHFFTLKATKKVSMRLSLSLSTPPSVSRTGSEIERQMSSSPPSASNPCFVKTVVVISIHRFE